MRIHRNLARKPFELLLARRFGQPLKTRRCTFWEPSLFCCFLLRSSSPSSRHRHSPTKRFSEHVAPSRTLKPTVDSFRIRFADQNPGFHMRNRFRNSPCAVVIHGRPVALASSKLLGIPSRLPSGDCSLGKPLLICMKAVLT